MSISPSNLPEHSERSMEDIVASIVDILQEYKRDIQETLKSLDRSCASLQHELEIVSDSLNNLLLSLSELSDGASRTLQENAGPNERTMLINHRERFSKRVVFGDVTNIV